mgnify:CR=1 FL=1
MGREGRFRSLCCRLDALNVRREKFREGLGGGRRFTFSMKHDAASNVRTLQVLSESEMYHDYEHAFTEGTGLRVYIRQRLPGVLGGSIEFTSEAGAGSTFSFIAPRDHRDQ